MMHRKYENDDLKAQARLQRSRDDYHVEYKIRRPSEKIPHYELPRAESFEGELEEEQSQFPRSTARSDKSYANHAQHGSRAHEKPRHTISMTGTDDSHVFQLPGSAMSSMGSSSATRACSSTTVSLPKVCQAQAADVLDSFAWAEEALARAFARLLSKRAAVQLEEEWVEKMSNHLVTLHGEIRQHVQGSNNTAGEQAGYPGTGKPE